MTYPEFRPENFESNLTVSPPGLTRKEMQTRRGAHAGQTKLEVQAHQAWTYSILYRFAILTMRKMTKATIMNVITAVRKSPMLKV